VTVSFLDQAITTILPFVIIDQEIGFLDWTGNMVQRDKWSVSVLQRKFNFVYKLY
jgi:hypothetical protein